MSGIELPVRDLSGASLCMTTVTVRYLHRSDQTIPAAAHTTDTLQMCDRNEIVGLETGRVTTPMPEGEVVNLLDSRDYLDFLGKVHDFLRKTHAG